MVLEVVPLYTIYVPFYILYFIHITYHHTLAYTLATQLTSKLQSNDHGCLLILLPNHSYTSTRRRYTPVSSNFIINLHTPSYTGVWLWNENYSHQSQGTNTMHPFSMTKLVESLEAGIATNFKGVNRDYGLCHNYNFLYHYPEIVKWFESWEHFSGDITYPVPSSIWLMSPQTYYKWALFGMLYRGKQLAYRKSLAQHIINCINKELAL